MARSRTHSWTGSQPMPTKRTTPSEVTGPMAVTNQPSLPPKDRNQPSKNQRDEQHPAEPREVSWAKGPPLLSPSSTTPSPTLASVPQTTQNSDVNTLYQLCVEMEVKMRALDARLRREIETACTAIRQEFRDMLNQAVSALKETLNSTVATLHALISSSISTFTY
ncbi:hypothetical protein HPB50_013414 [Hyalomma asiaticum]|uniref:Uncharacterized protein n=1 Tax=Hyalomma asiaticum TaxID=266040 RepID=A0ACB7RPG6_HYAAI|nr:hypothetical protein HPB50_013414 [Hyalomma asiaticum]